MIKKNNYTQGILFDIPRISKKEFRSKKYILQGFITMRRKTFQVFHQIFLSHIKIENITLGHVIDATISDKDFTNDQKQILKNLGIKKLYIRTMCKCQLKLQDIEKELKNP
jgi:hypothetical protein